MQQHEEHACGNPVYERSVLTAEQLARWSGSGVGCIEASPHEVRSDIEVERNGLVMIDCGSTQADFLYGKRSMAWEFTPGSIGFFAAGTELKLSQWRWTSTRRIYLDLDTDIPGGHDLMDSLRYLPRHTEIEFRDPELAAVLRTIVAEIAQGSPNGRLFAESLSLGVAMRIHQRANTRCAGGERGKLTPSQMQRVEDLVCSHIGRDLALSELAAAAGFSAPQFVRLFKRTAGCTPHQYVLKKRLAHAKELVLNGDLPLAMIASVTGFASQSHMTSAFVRTFSAPPGRLRRSALNGQMI